MSYALALGAEHIRDGFDAVKDERSMGVRDAGDSGRGGDGGEVGGARTFAAGGILDAVRLSSR